MLSSAVLVLNRSYMPVHVTTVRRALTLLYQGMAKAVNEQYELFNFDDWRQLRPREGDPTIGLVNDVILEADCEFLQQRMTMQEPYLEMLEREWGESKSLVRLPLLPYEVKGVDRLGEVETFLFGPGQPAPGS